MPPDESPTEIIEFDDEFYDDEFEEDYEESYEEESYEEDYDDDEFDDSDRAEPEYIEGERPAPRGRRRKPRKRGRRVFGWIAAVAVIALLAGGAWYGIDAIFGYEDYEGTGDSDVLVEIADGDSTNAIGAELAQVGVVASAKAFVKAGEDNSKVLGLQPGYYVLKTKMSGASAVAKLVQPDSRVGELQLRAGTQLDDITQPGGAVNPGVLSQLSAASCAELNGKSTCVSVEDLAKTAETADLAALGVPEWAVTAASKNTDRRRIEGLIAPGVYDVKPGWNAGELLGYVLRISALKLQAAGLPGKNGYQGKTPYEVLVIASLIEREGVQQDFAKISRVIYNRLDRNMALKFDSTVNYLLDKPIVTTTAEDRARPGAYNSYLNKGLPPTPISSPSQQAIQAAEQPAAGDILFFVKCEKNGLSCFAATDAEHGKNVADARARGVF